eukprot:CAMPEP_0167754078 /NCGR_PEP_ID=MMETSP0110_2-20121227/8070_1 /TAXON_ID=629695 /ORGANISM="Gymnochlora sp., Strain CCMP2014" /LENGTH=964 /DNA_ID=CAMNT_0007639917 /DNA_START=1014 /DNA_END=3906 /DNA_ORIENTATION=-
MIDVGGFLLPVKENSSPSSRSVSGKLGRLVGIDISQILKGLDKEKGDGLLNIAEFRSFWELLENGETFRDSKSIASRTVVSTASERESSVITPVINNQATRYFKGVLRLLHDRLSQKDRDIRPMLTSGIARTLLFLCHSFSIDPDSSSHNFLLRKILTNFKGAYGYTAASLMRALRLQSSQLLGSCDSETSASLVHHLVTVITSPEMAFSTISKKISTRRSSIKSEDTKKKESKTEDAKQKQNIWLGDFADMAYVQLRKLAYDEDIAPMILSAICTKCHTLPRALTTKPEQAGECLGDLCAIVKGVLESGAELSGDDLLPLAKSLAPYVFWPLPWGKEAIECLEMLEEEISSPGSCFRKFVEKEKSLRGIGHTERLNTHAGIPNVSAVVYHVASSSNSDTQKLSALIGVEEQSCLTPYRKQIRNKVQMFETTLKAMHILHREEAFSAAELDQFLELTVSEIYQFLQQHSELMEKVLKRLRRGEDPGSSEYKKWRHAEMTRLRKKFVGVNEKSISERKRKKSPEGLTRLFPIHILQQVKKRDFRESAPMIRYFLLRGGIDSQSLPMRIPSPGLNKAFQDVAKLQFSSCYFNNEDDMRMRITVSGGSDSLHAALCAYMNAIDSGNLEEKSKKIHPSFYIIPTMDGPLPSYLASIDPWYRRHIYRPFRRTVSLVPWLKSVQDTYVTPSDPRKLPAPGRFYKKLVDNYLRNARHQLKLQVFFVVATPTSTMKDTNCVIPFLTSCWVASASAMDTRRQLIRRSSFVSSSDRISIKASEDDFALSASFERCSIASSYKKRSSKGNGGTGDIKSKFHQIESKSPSSKSFSCSQIHISNIFDPMYIKSSSASIAKDTMKPIISPTDTTLHLMMTSNKKKKPTSSFRVSSVRVSVGGAGEDPDSLKARGKGFMIDCDDKIYGPFKRIHVIPASREALPQNLVPQETSNTRYGEEETSNTRYGEEETSNTRYGE